MDDLMQESSPPTSLTHRAGLFVLFLFCALAIFLFGSNYLRVFATNGNIIFSAGLAAIFLVSAVLFKRSKALLRYWPIAYAFFVASTVNLVSVVFAGYNTKIAHSFGVSLESTQGLAIGKLYDALLVITTILVLTRLSGADLGSLFLKKGNVRLGLGIGTLVLFNFLTSALIFYAPAYSSMAALGSAILWGTLFAFGNAFLEELWFRGLFLKHLVPLIGVAGTVLLTSVWFSMLHALAMSYLPSAVIPIFLVNTFTLGVACAILILKTESIWGAVMIHAAADLFLFIAVLATH